MLLDVLSPAARLWVFNADFNHGVADNLEEQNKQISNDSRATNTFNRADIFKHGVTQCTRDLNIFLDLFIFLIA